MGSNLYFAARIGSFTFEYIMQHKGKHGVAMT